MKRFLIVLVLVLAPLGAGGYYLWRYFQPRTPDMSGASTAKVESAKVDDTILVSGQVKPAITIDIRPDASGLVSAVSAIDGDRVSAGQELVRLDQKIAQSALEEAQANLRQVQLAQETAQMNLDEDGLALRKVTFERDQALLARGIIPKAQADSSELAYKQAERQMASAKRSMDGNVARIAQAQAAVDRAQTQLQQTVVRAPFDAVVLRRTVEVGSGVSGVSQSASGGTILMTLGDSRQSALYAKVTAADAKRIKPGMSARIRLDTDPADVLTGIVKSISTAGDVDQSSRVTTFPVVVTVTSQQKGNWVNVPAQAEIILQGSVEALVVPDRCVRTDRGGQSYVLIKNDTSSTRRDVELGVIQKDKMQIRNGVQAGQTLICR